MKRFLVGCLVFVLFVGLAIPGGFVSSPTARAQAGQTYTVLVGAEQIGLKAEFMKYFPSALQIHVGDTVTWQINSMEFHTVTFMAGQSLPPFVIPTPTADNEPSPLMVNPVVLEQTPANGADYDGSTQANSGLMGQDPNQIKTYSLKFTNEGTFDYACIIHGTVMSGTIEVVADSVTVPTPDQALGIAYQQIAAEKAKVPQAVQSARKQIVKPVVNGDGTVTFTVQIGGSIDNGGIDLMDFYPSHWVVRPGDTVIFEFSATNLAPHTVTFLNGGPDIPMVIPSTKVEGRLLLNPALLAPSPIPSTNISRTGLFNSGFMDPANPNTPHKYTIKIDSSVSPGPLSYECLLHDEMGMVGSLTVVPSTTTTETLMSMNTFPAWYTGGPYTLFMPVISETTQPTP